MKHLVAVTSCPTGVAHTLMAAEALKKAAEQRGINLRVETQGSVGTKNTLSEEEIAAADAVLIAADIRIDTSRFRGKPVYETRTSEAIRHTSEVLDATLALAPGAVETESPAPAIAPIAAPETKTEKRLVGITACPTGIAHTFMAANALEKAAKSLGHTIKVETQGSVGAKKSINCRGDRRGGRGGDRGGYQDRPVALRRKANLHDGYKGGDS
jgi:PTS system fructose-specific IIC component